jgi:hypothetical protein
MNVARGATAKPGSIYVVGNPVRTYQVPHTLRIGAIRGEAANILSNNAGDMDCWLPLSGHHVALART